MSEIGKLISGTLGELFWAGKEALEEEERGMGNDWTLEERPKRHRGAYKPKLDDIPFELSRGKVETFIKCPKCFWMEKVAGVKPPSIPAFLINTNTDTLLKKDFDQYRGKEPHPIMVKAGLEHLIPFEHEDLEKWELSIHFGSTPNHFNSVHRDSNILFGGGLDDVWQNKETGELHIVDYKSTAQMGANTKPLDETFLQVPKDSKYPDYKASYRRQMDMYQWIMRRKGYRVSNTGYFLYVDGQHNGIDGMIDKNNPATAWMKFNTAIIPYEGSDLWVDDALIDIRAGLDEIKSLDKRNAASLVGFNAPLDGEDDEGIRAFMQAHNVHAVDCEIGRFLKESWIKNCVGPLYKAP